MTSFSHNGIEITLEANGKFSARTSAGLIKAASLDAIKKRLDKDAANEFKPFNAFLIAGYSELTIVERTVTGIEKGCGRFGEKKFQTEKGLYSWLYVDTPENRAAATAYIEMTARHAAIRKQMADEKDAASAAIKTIRPGEVA